MNKIVSAASRYPTSQLIKAHEALNSGAPKGFYVVQGYVLYIEDGVGFGNSYQASARNYYDDDAYNVYIAMVSAAESYGLKGLHLSQLAQYITEAIGVK